MNTPPLTTFLDENQLPFVFCPGCGHGAILEHLNEALVMLAIDPRKVVIVTDIGCAGLSDKYFSTNAFHGLHGRSVTYATGIKLANPNLEIIVLIGDGGCGIGGHHLLNAARRNIGVTTIVFNNLNYGMTGGEHSVTTPPGGITSTTRYGQLEHPLDICGTVAANGASFVARSTTFDKDLPNLIALAIQNEGFSLLDIWELCTAHFVPNNKFSKKALEDTLKTLDFPTGIILDNPKPEYSKAYRSVQADVLGKPAMVGLQISPKFDTNLGEPKEIMITGAAGTKISSAATIFGQGAVLSGLWVTQRDDYPVTVKSGHSIAEIIISPEEIKFTGIIKPDLMIVLFQQGLEKSRKRLAQLTKKDVLVISADLPEVNTPAKVFSIDFKTAGPLGRKKEYRAVMALATVLRHFDLYPLDAFKEAMAFHPRFLGENLAAVEASQGIDFQHY
jgi:pyruvate/2-oxoacid:ferredoxin oxidoreductase beta subunit/Pyruvate/2-oxoacid:ferredoxin oxidoreductase gamma subunit